MFVFMDCSYIWTNKSSKKLGSMAGDTGVFSLSTKKSTFNDNSVINKVIKLFCKDRKKNVTKMYLISGYHQFSLIGGELRCNWMCSHLLGGRTTFWSLAERISLPNSSWSAMISVTL